MKKETLVQLNGYCRHNRGCGANHGSPCTCGLEEARKYAFREQKDPALEEDMAKTKMSEHCKDRIRAYIDCPCRNHWDDIYCIVINYHYTVWQAVIGVDPTFPRTGKRTDQAGKVIKDWEAIPHVDTVRKALYLAVNRFQD